ncbi:hypothetical protein GCM10010211_55030 [Streptomyces albospinus]|uniref:Type A2 lantipeptide n=1 Tax=Streptomyces albospinus TaxID=285515 RepID=A0ABQ2VGM0_9ACTN|nr:hypothetical protein [Streptomyces albospinus]GGU82055.1 hypothetical protein GCM10010211_55030 [Streptomyces albospinus]
MSNSSPIETREISDADLDGVAGGLSVGGTVDGLVAKVTQGPGGVPVLEGSVKSIGITVSDIPLGPIAL